MSGNQERKRIGDIKNWFMELSKNKKIAVCAGGSVLCLVMIAMIFLAAKLGKLNSEDINADDLVMSDEAWISAEGYTNVALFGIDSRSGELEKGTRTDCLIVASLNNETKEIKMVSVYRDTVLDIEENYLQKCNAAYAFGGPTQAINMLNKNLDLNIQEYVTVDFAAIANAIDMLGGLEIDVKEEEVKPLNKFVKETARVAGKKAKKISEPGLQLLDGVQATTYARIRSTAGGDFTRTERQRLVIEKIIEKAQTSDLATINGIIDELLPTIKTSFSAGEILAYAKYFAKYSIAGSEGFPFEKTTDTVSGLGSIVIPVTLSDNVCQLHEFLYGDTEYEPSETVQMINDAILARVGQREATDYDTLSSQTYVDTEEDKAQEHNEYQPKPEADTSEEAEDQEEKAEDTSEDTKEDIASDSSDKETSDDKVDSKPEKKPEAAEKPEQDKEKPTEKPSEKPTGNKPSEDKPMGNKPSEDKKPPVEDNSTPKEEDKKPVTPPVVEEEEPQPPKDDGGDNIEKPENNPEPEPSGDENKEEVSENKQEEATE